MKLLLDMNLSPDWVTTLIQAGWETVHWSSIGDFRANDSEIMAWAKQNGHVVFTHDLDFGSLLAITHAGGGAKRNPSSHTGRGTVCYRQTGVECAPSVSTATGSGSVDRFG
jgi:hypothetical protein